MIKDKSAKELENKKYVKIIAECRFGIGITAIHLFTMKIMILKVIN